MSGCTATPAEVAARNHEDAVRRDQARREGIATHELDAIRAAFALLDKLSPAGQIRALDWLNSALHEPRPDEVPF